MTDRIILQNERIKQLEREIENLKQKVENATTWSTRVRQIQDYTDTEKIAAFNRLYQQTYNHVKEVAETRWCDEDNKHYLYEAIMEETMGKDVWDILKNL